MALLAKIDEVITFTNEWYGTIITDLETNGTLFQSLNAQFLANFAQDITTLQNNIGSINSNLLNVHSLITNLQYTKPSINLTSSPNGGNFAMGDSINGVMLNYNVNIGTNAITKAEVYKNGALLNTITNVNNGSNSFVDGSQITNNTSYYIKIYDDTGTVVQSNPINFNFLYKTYYGKVVDGTVVSDTIILGLSNTLFDNNFTFNETLNNQKIVIASYYDLTSILDSDNFDNIGSFDKSIVNLNVNNVQTPYNVYVSTNPVFNDNPTIILEK
jgi:hypothetical protein